MASQVVPLRILDTEWLLILANIMPIASFLMSVSCCKLRNINWENDCYTKKLNDLFARIDTNVRLYISSSRWRSNHCGIVVQWECSKTCLDTVLIRSIFAREKLHERSAQNFNEMLIKIQKCSFTKMHLKLSSAKRWPLCPRGWVKLIGFTHYESYFGMFCVSPLSDVSVLLLQGNWTGILKALAMKMSSWT